MLTIAPHPIPGFRLVGEDSNAFAIIARFQRAARKAGLPAEAIAAVEADATSSNYDHLVATYARWMEHSKPRDRG